MMRRGRESKPRDRSSRSLPGCSLLEGLAVAFESYRLTSQFMKQANRTSHAEAVAAPPRRNRASAEARRAQILTAALGCISQKGYYAATMDDLVRASGLSKGSLYWHFKSKEEVFLALFDAFTLEIYQAWDRVEQTERDLERRLRGECEVTVELLSRDRPRLRAWAEFMTHPAAQQRFAASYLDAQRRLTEIVRAGRADGIFSDGASDDAVAIALVAAVEGLLVQFLVLPDFDLKARFESTWDVLMGGLRQ
jgi:AcrR family transcriptional regulator